MASGNRTDLAEDRTDLAEDRTVLAHERSFAGWLRTGMAAVGIGLGFNALFGTVRSPEVTKAIASFFLLVASFIFVSAALRTTAVLRRLDDHCIKSLKPMRVRLLSGCLTAATLALLAAIWLLAPA